jgi:hypothetical protein
LPSAVAADPAEAEAAFTEAASMGVAAGSTVVEAAVTARAEAAIAAALVPARAEAIPDLMAVDITTAGAPAVSAKAMVRAADLTERTAAVPLERADFDPA